MKWTVKIEDNETESEVGEDPLADEYKRMSEMSRFEAPKGVDWRNAFCGAPSHAELFDYNYELFGDKNEISRQS